MSAEMNAYQLSVVTAHSPLPSAPFSDASDWTFFGQKMQQSIRVMGLWASGLIKDGRWSSATPVQVSHFLWCEQFSLIWSRRQIDNCIKQVMSDAIKPLYSWYSLKVIKRSEMNEKKSCCSLFLFLKRSKTTIKNLNVVRIQQRRTLAHMDPQYIMLSKKMPFFLYANLTYLSVWCSRELNRCLIYSAREISSSLDEKWIDEKMYLERPGQIHP